MGALVHTERILLACQRLALASPRSTVSLALGIILICAVGILRLTQVVSIRDQLDPRLQSTIDLGQTDRDFSGDPSLIVTVEAQSKDFTAGELCQVRRMIGMLEADKDSISSVASPFDLRRVVSTKDALHYPEILEDVCLGEASRVVSLEPLQRTPWGHLFVGPQLRDVSFTISLNPGPQGGKFGTFRPEVVSSVIQKIEEKLPGAVRITGTAAQEFYTMKGLAEAQWLNVLIFILIALSFWYFLGTWKSSLIYGMTIVPAATIVYGMMGWVGHAIDPLSVCLFLMLAISSIEDFVFVSHEMTKRPDRATDAFRSLILPSLMSSLTTIAAFGTLGFSELESIRRFGIWAAVGGAVEWMIMFICLPALVKLWPGLLPWALPGLRHKESLLQRVLRKTPPRSVTRVSLSAFVFAVFSVQNFNLAQTPTDVFPKDHPLQRSIDKILQDRGWVASVGLVYATHTSDALKSHVRETVKADAIVFRSESWPEIVDFVAGHTTPSLERSLVERELSITNLSKRYNSVAGMERDMLYLRSSNTAEINRLRGTVEAKCPKRECWLAGEFVAFADYSQQLIVTLFESLFASLLIVAFIIGYVAWERGHLVLVPGLLLSSFFGPAVMLTVLYAFGLSVNFVTCVVASALIGLTGDNALMFLLTDQGSLSQNVEERGIASVQTAIVMALCSLTFVFSYFEPPRMLGILLATGFLFSVVGDVWLLKGLMPKKSYD